MQRFLSSDEVVSFVSALVLLVAVLLMPAAAQAQAQASQLVLLRADSTYVLDDYIGHVVDPDGTLSWSEVVRRDASAFAVAGEPHVAPEGSRSVIWLRLDLSSHIDHVSQWRLMFMADSAEVRRYDASGNVQQRMLTGYRVPVAERDVQLGFPPMVELTLPADDEGVVLARVRVGHGTYSASSGSLRLPQLQPAATSAAQTLGRRLGQGLFLGFMLAMLGYNLFLFASVRDRGYLWYVLFLACFSLFWLLTDAFIQEWAWPAAVSTQPDLVFYVIPVGFASYLLFTQHFLGTHARVPWLHRVTQGILGLHVVPVVLGLVGWWSAATLSAALLALVVVSVTTAIGLRVLLVSGYPPSRFYFSASLFFIVGTVVYTLTWLGVFPVNPLTKYSIQIGSACEAFLLSLGLAARIKLLRSEAREAHLRRREAEEAKRVLEEANRIKGELMGIAAHDLRSPLMAIRDFSDIVREEAGFVASVREPLQLIRDAAVRMLRLVDDLLVTAVLDNGRAEVRREEVDLVEVVGEVVQTYTPRARQKGQRLFLRAEARDAAVVADGVRLRNAVDNLVSNALKYAPGDTEVEATVRTAAMEVQVRVRDEGPGLTDEDLEHVFEPYQRLSAKPTGGEDSTGLGLSITKQIIEVHGGRIWVESEPGRGSTFCFALPRAEYAEYGAVVRGGHGGASDIPAV